MSEDLSWEVEKIASDMRVKYVYFLLAAVGACIGFAITQSKSATLVFWNIPLGLAVCSWAISFFLGCVYIHKKMNFFDHKILISVISDENRSFGNLRYKPSDEYIDHQRKALENMKREVDVLNHRSNFLYKSQLFMFSLGAFFYLVWHVVEMWRRTPEYMCLWV